MRRAAQVALVVSTPGPARTTEEGANIFSFRHQQGPQVFKGEYDTWCELCDRAQKLKPKYFGETWCTHVVVDTGMASLRFRQKRWSYVNHAPLCSVQPRGGSIDNDDEEYPGLDEDAVDGLEDGSAVGQPPALPRSNSPGHG